MEKCQPSDGALMFAKRETPSLVSSAVCACARLTVSWGGGGLNDTMTHTLAGLCLCNRPPHGERGGNVLSRPGSPTVETTASTSSHSYMGTFLFVANALGNLLQVFDLHQ